MLATGCDKKDTPTDETSDTGLPTDNASGQPLPTFSNVGGEVGGTMATIQFDFASFPGLPTLSYGMAFATFGTGADAGLVRVNSDTLSKMTSGTETYYNTFASTSPKSLNTVSFNGTAHTWNVAGAGTIPAIASFAVTSPSSFSVTSPAANGTVTKASGMTITWTGSSTADSVMIVLAGQGGYVLKQGVTGTSVTISSTELGSMTGAAVLQIVKYRYATRTVNSKVYVAVAEIVKTVNVTIN
jgi:hypothetical protein